MPVAIPMAIGAAVGAASAAIQGGSILKGAAFGAIGGGVGGAISGAIGGAAGAEAGGIAGGEAGAAGGAISGADAAGLAQMAADAGLTGQAASDFVASGGTLGSTAAGGGGVGYGASQEMIDAGYGAAGGEAIQGGLLNSAGEGATVTDGVTETGSSATQAPSPTQVGNAPPEEELSATKRLANDLVDVDGTPEGHPSSHTPAESKGLLDSAVDWAKANPRLASAALDVGGRALSGAAQSVGAVQAVKTKAQLDLESKEKLAEFYRNMIQSGSAGGVGVRLAGPTGPTPPLTRPGGAPVFTNGLLNSGRA